jgi:hypothetical protein
MFVFARMLFAGGTMANNPAEPPAHETKGMTPAVVGYLIAAIIIALILWRFVFAR